MKESASFKKYRLQLRDLPTIKVQDVEHVSLATYRNIWGSGEKIAAIVGCAYVK